MTKDEIIRWVKSSKHVVTDYNEYDSNGNHYARDILERDGELWSVEYINGKILPAIEISPKGSLVKEDFYQLKKVRQVQEEITRYEYVNDK